MIRTAALTVLALGAMTAPALAFESHSAPAPHVNAAFTDGRVFEGMVPTTTSTPFHFGAAEAPPMVPDQPQTKKPTVVYELKAGKAADRIDVTDPRDNPFMAPIERSDKNRTLNGVILVSAAALPLASRSDRSRQ